MNSIIEAVKKGEINASLDVVISNNPEAKGLETAKEHGIDTKAFDLNSYTSRAEFDLAIIKFLKPRNIDLVVLAGYMLLVGADFVSAYKSNMINIHPSLLPSFIGRRPHQQALDYGVKLAGCTVHFVTEGLDDGPIIMQAAVPLLEDDNEASLAARVLKEENRILPECVNLIVEGKVKFKRSIRHEKSIN
ncbi:phosphoribosylglycinamide formyltransferase [Candidatus Marinamargulisbacteria bacterium SCGC AAA071-K20]|nr:phosphoribosylglycinamide formyltransferase [Candidatus Marinamargulisbacteria bacterium SCGC AAA071-K20]